MRTLCRSSCTPGQETAWLEQRPETCTIDPSLIASLAALHVPDLLALARRAHARGFHSTLGLVRNEFRFRGRQRALGAAA